MKRSLLSLVLFCLAFFSVARAQVTIGDLATATTDTYLPMNSLYEYSYSQQIYTADEIGMAGTINSITVWMYGNANLYEIPFDIYMVETDKESFAGVTDWIPVSADDIVYSGSVTVHNTTSEAYTFDLSSPFQYGGGNLVIAFDNNCGQWKSGLTGMVFGADTDPFRSIYARRDSNDYDPTAMSSVTASGTTYKRNVIEIDITPSGEPYCARPKNIAIDYQGGTTASVTWNGDANQYNIDVNGTVTYNVTSPFPLNDLALATEYTVKMQAVCGGENGSSEWTGGISFTTDACMPEDKISVNYALTDSYGDGWNGNAILVVDENCNIVDQLTISSGNSASGTLKVCGSYVQFLWYMGSYPTETSWSFTDSDGNVLFAGAGNANMATLDVLYTIDNNPYSAPTDVAVSEVGPRSAKLSWTETGTATAWQILLTAGDDEEGTIIDANSNPFVLTGLATETEYYAQVRAIGTNGNSIWTCLGADFTTTEACPLPTEIVVSGVTANSALVSWLGFGESYDLRYAVNPAPIVRRSNGTRSISNNGNYTSKKMVRGTTFASTNDKAATVSVTGINHDRDGWHYYDNGEWDDGAIGTGGGNFWWGIMFPAGSYRETNLAKTAVYDYMAMTGNVTIYNDGDTIPAGEVLAQADVTLTGSGQFVETNFGEVTIDPSKNLWIIYYNGSGATYPAAYCTAQNDANGRWVSTTGTDWMDVSTAVEGCGDFMIRAYLGTITYDWIEVNGITDSEYQLTGLDPETSYIVQIRSNCGDDGQTDYTDGNSFTTMSACDAPNELGAEVAATSATLTWSGAQESYNLRWWRPAQAAAFDVADFTQVGQDYTAESVLTTYTIDLSAFSGVGNVAIRHYNITDMFRLNVDDIVVTNAQGQVVASEDFETGVINSDLLNIDVDGDGKVWSIWAITDTDANGNPVGNGSYCATSASYDNSGALNPDNWLIIPNVELGGTLTFVARGQDASWASEVFGVFVSTTQLLIAGTEPVVVENVTSPYELTGLDPNTTYEFQVQGVNASCGEIAWSEIQSFTTLAGLTQTIELVSGTNYIASSVDITLADLEAALAATWTTGHNITIKSQNKNVVYRAGRWIGQLNESNFDVASMYVILIDYATEITLEGAPINPADHPITVPAGGTVYIGFPLTTSMTPADAFAGFAANGDVVKSQNQNSTYRGTRWVGQLSTLEPGKGYKYISNATSERTLVFPAE